MAQPGAEPMTRQAVGAAPATAVGPGPQKGGADASGVYALIRRDQSPLAKETLELIDATNMSVHPRFWAYLASVLGPTFRFLALAAIALAIAMLLKLPIPWAFLPLLLIFPAVIIAAKLVEIRTTTITFEGGRILVSKGAFAREVHNIELYRVLDIALQRSFVNRLTGDGTLILTVEGIHGSRDPFRVSLPGLAKIADLEELFKRLRSLVLLLRTGPWGKGLIY